jgi:hypothetical protein
MIVGKSSPRKHTPDIHIGMTIGITSESMIILDLFTPEKNLAMISRRFHLTGKRKRKRKIHSHSPLESI